MSSVISPPCWVISSDPSFHHSDPLCLWSRWVSLSHSHQLRDTAALALDHYLENTFIRERYLWKVFWYQCKNAADIWEALSGPSHMLRDPWSAGTLWKSWSNKLPQNKTKQAYKVSNYPAFMIWRHRLTVLSKNCFESLMKFRSWCKIHHNVYWFLFQTVQCLNTSLLCETFTMVTGIHPWHKQS